MAVAMPAETMQQEFQMGSLAGDFVAALRGCGSSMLIKDGDNEG